MKNPVKCHVSLTSKVTPDVIFFSLSLVVDVVEEEPESAHERGSSEQQSDPENTGNPKLPRIDITPVLSLPSESSKDRLHESTASVKSRSSLKKLFRRSRAVDDFSPTPTNTGGPRSDTSSSMQSLDSSNMTDFSDANSVNSASTSTSTSGTPLMTGTLNKYSSTIPFRKWQSRNYELRENTLHIFDPEHPTKTPKSIKFAEIAKIDEVQEKKFGKKYTFLVDFGNKTTYFQASNDAELNSLLHHIRQRVAH